MLARVAFGMKSRVILVTMAIEGNATATIVASSVTRAVTVAIVILLAVLVVSYRQVIAAFPGGGGAYAVAGKNRNLKTHHFGPKLPYT